MALKLPMYGFAWEKFDDFIIKDKKGHILEVDVGYPKQLHIFSKHNENNRDEKSSPDS